MGRTARQAPAEAGWVNRLMGRFGRQTPEPASPPAEQRLDDGPALETLAVTLAELIAAAQGKVEAAAGLVGRSARDAEQYRETLTTEVAALDEALARHGVAGGLIEVTRAMIERTQVAELRLRSAAEEFDRLQADLDEAREAAERDPLTGLPNRRALEQALASAVDTARAADAALSLAFCDIDNFKALNDAHGHALGDRVLRLVADCLSDQAGDGVFVGRQGGEEFIMLFEGIHAEEAAIRVDAIRARLAGRTMRSRTTDAPIGRITFSAGVATLADGEVGHDLLGRADRALYRAKHGGRNRVEIDRNQ